MSGFLQKVFGSSMEGTQNQQQQPQQNQNPQQQAGNTDEPANQGDNLDLTTNIWEDRSSQQATNDQGNFAQQQQNVAQQQTALAH